MDKVELFKTLSTDEKLRLIDGLKKVEYQEGEYIFHEGDTSEHFYIIEKGEIECGKESEQGFGRVRTLKAGSHFGEIALINRGKRTESTRSVGNTHLLSLTKECFERILGSIIDNPLFQELLAQKGYTANKEL